METPFRWLLLFVLTLVVASLGEGLFFLVRDGRRSERSRVAVALTARVLLSLLLFALVMGGSLFGLV